jgi:lipoprotein-anchoring transpeptidase ErfK/SrfK
MRRVVQRASRFQDGNLLALPTCAQLNIASDFGGGLGFEGVCNSSGKLIWSHLEKAATIPKTLADQAMFWWVWVKVLFGISIESSESRRTVVQTIKTAVVVVMLLAVLYGAYVALNGSDTPLPPGLGDDLVQSLEGGPDVLMPMPGATEPAPFFPETQVAKSDTALLPPNSGPQNFEFPSTDQTTAANSLPFPALEPAPKTQLAANTTSVPATDSTADKSNWSPPSLELSNSPDSSGSIEPPSLTLPNLVSTSTPAFDTTSPSESAFPAAPPSLENSAGGSSDADLSESGDAQSNSELASDLPNSTTSRSYENAKKLAFEQISQGKLKEALSTLSVFYNSPELTSQQAYELLDILDPLAGEVIYSPRHLLDIPHEVGPNETMASIAKQYEIEPELLSKINRLEDGRMPPQGTKLKIIPGPFRAEVDLKNSELTMFVGELYAGRFAISLGQDPPPREGVYQVVGKQLNRNYYGQGGTQIDGTDPRNPYGGVFIDLGHGLCIHGSPAQAGAPSASVLGDKLGCISLSPIDARDVFGMLGFDCKIQINAGH